VLFTAREQRGGVTINETWARVSSFESRTSLASDDANKLALTTLCWINRVLAQLSETSTLPFDGLSLVRKIKLMWLAEAEEDIARTHAQLLLTPLAAQEETDYECHLHITLARCPTGSASWIQTWAEWRAVWADTTYRTQTGYFWNTLLSFLLCGTYLQVHMRAHCCVLVRPYTLLCRTSQK
jgi:hypothetical protein